MIVDFNTLPNDSRLWIYQSNREFTIIELEEIEALTKTFLKKVLTNETKFALLIIRRTKTYDLVSKWVQVRTLNRTYQV